jgi:hypothetical protein
VAAATKRRIKDGAALTDMVTLGDLRMDSDVQPRESINTALIGEYAEAMRNDEQFPNIIVYRDGDVLYLADGWHRVMAAKEAEKATLNAEIREGTKRDAILYSIGANTRHGLRPTNADKRRAVRRLLIDPEWSSWSDSVIADRAGVSQPFVSSLRNQMTGDDDEPKVRRVKTSDGREMDTTRIGRSRKRADEDETEEVEAPVATDEAQNGHAPVSLVLEADDDEDEDEDEVTTQVGDIETEEDEEATDTIEGFAKKFAAMMMEIGDHDPNEVFAAMDEDTLGDLADKWNDIIGQFDAYSGALEAALSE